MISKKGMGGIFSRNIRRHHSVFISYADKGTPCAVELVYDLIKNRFFESKKTLLNAYHAALDEILSSRVKNLNSLSIYAHPDNNLKGFACNSVSKDSYTVDAFDSIVAEDNLIYAHVCEGAKILGNNNHKFKYWVSYSDGHSMNYGKPGDKEFYSQFFKNIESGVKSSKDFDSLLKGVERAYFLGFDELYAYYKPVDIINLFYLQEAFELIETS